MPHNWKPNIFADTVKNMFPAEKHLEILKK